jgi:hypothetical protein
LSKNNFSKSSPLFAITVMAAALWLGAAHAAFAQLTPPPSTLGTIFCNAVKNARPFGDVFAYIAYVSGIISMLRGIHLLRMHAEDPRNHKLNVPLMFLFGAACLLMFPTAVATIENTLYVPVLGGGLNAIDCTAGAVPPSVTGLEGMLTNFVTNISVPLSMVISITAVLAGLLMILRGLMKASKYGTDPKTNSIHSILTHLGFGALLVTLGDNLQMMLDSVFGSGTHRTSAIAWGASLSAIVTPEFQTAVNSALIFVQLIGGIAFVRGWLVMKKVVEGGSNATLTQGLTHIIGGVLAINIGGFLTLMDVTFGTNLLH